MCKHNLARNICSHECERERDSYSFLTSLSDIQDLNISQEQDNRESIYYEDSSALEGSEISIHLLPLDLNSTDENENENEYFKRNILLLSAKRKEEARQKKKISKRVSLLSENTKKKPVESSSDSSRDYDNQLNWKYEVAEYEEHDVKLCGCHKSRKAKCFKELEIECLEKGDIKRSLFYRGINEWCKEYEINKTREVCVPLIQEFYLHENGSDDLF
ncbi:hypothetical protein SMKI_06G1920 [Saccharomyces mikatae IFO 1815]|uniref:YGR153W-like protein n=1 Tax=Saccharomyces mikatae IFO 1815 TaxID=226126 RepID=A0AA35IYG5_SACMI|nr:uncharacterized protein SMKI_06G1920 [Saccharomyces mikatae IFO 1815]CAI4038843.1 hypothetical protein SMKI_06G1920 [Saccharomyces mikatae IFO 1815]